MNSPPFYLLLGNPLVRQKLVQPWPHRHHRAVGIWGNFEQLEYVSNNLPLVFSLCWTGRQEVRLTYVKVRQVEEHLDLPQLLTNHFLQPVNRWASKRPWSDTWGRRSAEDDWHNITEQESALSDCPQWQAPVNPWANWLFSIQRFIFRVGWGSEEVKYYFAELVRLWGNRSQSLNCLKVVPNLSKRCLQVIPSCAQVLYKYI